MVDVIVIVGLMTTTDTREKLGQENREAGLFCRPQELLKKFGVEKERADLIIGAINSGEWLRRMEDRRVVEAEEPSKERQIAGGEVMGYKGTRSVELHFSLMEMMGTITTALGMEDEMDKIRSGFSENSKCLDVELNLAIPVGNNEVTEESIVDGYKNRTRMGMRVGGWTSDVGYMRKHGENSSNSPRGEADLAQQYFYNHRDEAVICVGGNGPAMGKGVLKDGVKEFSPTDYAQALGMASAFIHGGGDIPIDIEGHSMGGALVLKISESVELPKGSTAVAVNPAIAGTNVWSGEKLEVSRGKKDNPAIAGARLALSMFIRHGLEIINKTPGSEVIRPIETLVSAEASKLLLLMGDGDKVDLLGTHVEQMIDHIGGSSACARGCNNDKKIDFAKMKGKKVMIVTDAGDQMVDAASTLKQMPREMPLMVLTGKKMENESLDKRIRDGSHYANKRNERALALAEIQKCQERLTDDEFAELNRWFWVMKDKLKDEGRVETILNRNAGELFADGKFVEMMGFSNKDIAAYLRKREDVSSIHSVSDYLIKAGLTKKEIANVSTQFEIRKIYDPSRTDELAESLGFEGMGKLELMIQCVDVLRRSVHFNEEGDELFHQ